LLLRVRRYRCTACKHVWRQDTTRAADDRVKLSRGAVTWALVALVVAHLTVARVAEALGVAWDTANDAVLAEGHRVLIADPARFDGVTVIGVDEHVWRHTRRGDKYVTVIIDLTPVRDGKGPARLLDMIEGRSKQVFKQWLANRPKAWQVGVEVVAMDGFTGFKTAAAEELGNPLRKKDAERYRGARRPRVARNSRTPTATSSNPLPVNTATFVPVIGSDSPPPPPTPPP
jgi:transposase